MSAGILTLPAGPVIANVALPAFLPHSLATLLGLLVIAAIEGWFLMRATAMRYSESCWHAAHANWKSTVVGIPFAWLLWMVGMIPLNGIVTAFGLPTHPAADAMLMQTVLIGGSTPSEWLDVGSAAAWIVLLVPFYFGSVWIEKRTLVRRLPRSDPAAIAGAVVRGNLATYAIFLLLGLAGLAHAVNDLPNQRIKFERQRERVEKARQAMDKKMYKDVTEPRGKPSGRNP